MEPCQVVPRKCTAVTNVLSVQYINVHKVIRVGQILTNLSDRIRAQRGIIWFKHICRLFECNLSRPSI